MVRFNHGLTSLFHSTGIAPTLLLGLIPILLPVIPGAQQFGVCNPASGSYDVVTNRLPANCYPYPLNKSMWANRLPVDKMLHLWNAQASGLSQSSDYYAKQAITAEGSAPINCSEFAFIQGGAVPAGCNVGPNGGVLFGGHQQFVSASSDPNFPRATNDGYIPKYYAKSSDPVFSNGLPGNGTTCTTGPFESPSVCLAFHAPPGAQFVWFGGGRCYASETTGAAGNGQHCAYSGQCPSAFPVCLASTSGSTFQPENLDSELVVFDQAQGLFVGIEAGKSDTPHLTFPNCTQGNCASVCNGHAGTLADPCVLPDKYSYQDGTSFLNDWDWREESHTETINGVTEYLGAGGANGIGMQDGGADPVTFEDLQNGIFHIVSGAGTDNSIVPLLWPGTVSAILSQQTTNGLPGGALTFLDYTDGQIAAMGLGPIQKILVTQWAHYGSVQDVWTDSSLLQVSEAAESGLPYMLASGTQHPFYQWVNGQKIGVSPTGYQYTVNCHNNPPPTAQYNCEFDALYGLPLETCTVGATDPGCATRTDSSGRQCSVAPGCDVSGHIHVIDPGVLAGFIGPNQRSGEPAPTTGLVAVMISGTGSGSITSNPGGMNCDHIVQCNIAMGIGTSVALTAVPAAGSTFVGWNGAGCSGTGACTVTFGSTPQSLKASFNSATGSVLPPAKPKGVVFQ